ncbi:MAG: hypothetical protein NZ924_06865, partial [Candidatus Bipolaricaulota bacterium]|nr:hypothetical protein [Candidatus Bipolaricaulota bacterium]MDW8152599.1 hypothetical protein [Candidatus Bipolaricaulota bacterium]
SNKEFFAHLVERGEVEALLDFENRERLFPGIDSRIKFAVLALRPPSPEPARLAFFLTQPDQAQDPVRQFRLAPRDFALLNPNTRTCPVFRTRQDAELTRAIHGKVPVLWREEPEENPWGVRFLRMLDMTHDAHLFHTRADLEAQGFHLEGNRFLRGKEVYLPLYEGSNVQTYHHRFASYDATRRSPVRVSGPEKDPSFL